MVVLVVFVAVLGAGVVGTVRMAWVYHRNNADDTDDA